jgi:hypothetical protein
MGLAWVPLMQVIVHATATWWFWYELRRWGMAGSQAFAAAFAVGIGCTAMDQINVIATDALAASFGVMTVIATMRWARLGGSATGLLLPALLAVMAIAIRPAYLFLPLWLLVGGACLHRCMGMRWNSAIGAAAAAAALTVIPIVGWSTVRYATVADFAVAPFGHQNLGGVLVQLVSEDELNGLGKLGQAVAKRKHDYIRSLGKAANDDPNATMTIDARWDAMTYQVVMPAADEVAGEGVIQSHRAIRAMNRSIVRNWPWRYANWIAKAVRRGAWSIAADIVMHPIFLLMIGLALVLILERAINGEPSLPATIPSRGLNALTIVGITYLFLKLGFVSLTSPPIGRFGDAAAIFLPALAAAGFVRWYGHGQE